MNELQNLSPTLLAALGALIVVQLALQVSALVSLARTPESRVALGGRKWLWVLIIVLGEILGPIVYFAGGRLPAYAEDRPSTVPASGRAQAAADTLYGAGPQSAVSDEALLVPSDDPELGADGTGMGELP